MRYLITILGFLVSTASHALANDDAGQDIDQGIEAGVVAEIGTTYFFEEYYSPISDLSGQDLHKALNGIVREHKVIPFHDAFYALDETDQDLQNENKVRLLYTERAQLKDTKYWGGRSVYRWDVEQVWAASHGFPNENQAAYSDLHNLRAADTTVNKSRGNKDFDDGGYQHKEAAGVHHDSDSFEPPKAAKGDIARILFYMAVAYDGNMNNTPDLKLSLNDAPNSQPKFGHLCTLLAWNAKDKPDEFEQRRNDKIFEIQGNRNPFIDNPKLAGKIWGEKCPSIGIWESL